jgi:alpha-beta hydrolase superfamily lysophospholipase
MSRVVELPASGETRAVVLVLHGGKEHSHAPVSPWHSSPLRMVPFAKAIHRAGREHGVAVWRVHYAVRGWNGDQRSPVTDARAALDRVREQHGGVPVVLVGHSMGGRAAAHALDDPSVTAMVGLAPWLPNDPVDGAVGKRVLVAHGDHDRIASATDSLAWVARARAAGGTMTYVSLRGCGHYLLRRTPLWTDLTTGFALQSLGIPTRVGPTAQAAIDQVDRTVTV